MSRLRQTHALAAALMLAAAGSFAGGALAASRPGRAIGKPAFHRFYPTGDVRATGLAVAKRGTGILVAGGTAPESQPDVSPLEGGSQVALTAFTAGLQLDPAFGQSGQVVTDLPGDHELAKTAFVQQDGKVVVGGQASDHPFLARYRRDGTLDPAFGTGGVNVLASSGEEVTHIASAPGGKVWALLTPVSSAGPSAEVLRFTSAGAIDSSFRGGVLTIFSSAYDADGVADGGRGRVFVLQDRVVARRGITPIKMDIVVDRVLNNGKVDPSFRVSRRVLTGSSTCGFGSPTLAVTGRHEYVGTGIRVVRFLLRGGLDRHWARGGIARVLCQDTITPDGRGDIVTAFGGSEGIRLQRLGRNGRLDRRFGKRGTAVNVFNPGATEEVGYRLGGLVAGGKHIFAGGTWASDEDLDEQFFAARFQG